MLNVTSHPPSKYVSYPLQKRTIPTPFQFHHDLWRQNTDGAILTCRALLRSETNDANQCLWTMNLTGCEYYMHTQKCYYYGKRIKMAILIGIIIALTHLLLNHLKA